MVRASFFLPLASALCDRGRWTVRRLATTTNEVTIEAAGFGDIEEIQRCNRASLPENYADSFYERHLKQWPDLSFVARADGAVAGYVLGRLDENLGHITSLAVNREWRRLGLARRLMHSVHAQLVKRDVSVSRLHVRCSNFKALKLYSSLGYTIHTVVRGYYADGEAAYLMAATLHLPSKEVVV
ncbi:hypothetical protein CTAYLR_007182 [Chrysophaeum taylorii]|uniref:N-acetyltransferase domain-containing protein n=1 Tax=Chrysophaeum taylorii TaxID=2483200 RepID=A0AAD7UJY4_9STRA|nr:hypothetical protein CTAYLR_007182 [Chrysophaeum taylorii]